MIAPRWSVKMTMRQLIYLIGEGNVTQRIRATFNNEREVKEYMSAANFNYQNLI